MDGGNHDRSLRCGGSYSETSNNGLSERRTTSVQRTNSIPPTALTIKKQYICEEAWEKGPIVAKYCFEKNALKVLQIFRRHGKRDQNSIQVAIVLRKTHLKILQIYTLFLSLIKRSPSSALTIPQSTKKVKNLKFDCVTL